VTDWLLLNVGVVAVSFAIMLIPTAIISRLSPVKPLRFE
jgi:ABC-type antimicrobial peptide transport system permease subunit